MKETLNAIIVEDEVISRDILKKYLESYCTNVTILGEAENIDEGEKLIQKYEPDLVFLDIEMPYGNGFDLLDRLIEVNFEVVFITAYSDYAIRALNLSAAYYILKPIDIDELILAVNKIHEKYKSKTAFSSTKVLAENIKSINNKSQKIVLPQMDGFEVVKLADIIRVEAADNYTVFFLTSGQKHTISKTLKYYEELLTEFGFLRTHKSHLVNLSHIVKYKKGKTGQVILSDQSTALVSPAAKKELLAHFSI